ncbi:MAG: class A beta-lactamase [Caldimonas sp.]
MNRRDLLATAPLWALLPAKSRAAEAPFEAYEAASGGRIGVYAKNLVTGAGIAWRADTRFVMCSTFKASLAGLVLSRVDAGKDALDHRVRFGRDDLLEYAPVARKHLASGTMSVDEMCAGAVELSDNTCANLLLARAGGPAALTAFWRSLGDRISRLDHDEPLLNRTPPGGIEDTTTPAAMAHSLRGLVLGQVLSSSSRERLTGWLIGCKTGANRLRAGLPEAWTIGDKTGNNGKDASGDIAIAWPRPAVPIVICVYTRGGTPTDRQTQTVFTAIGRLVGQQLA